MNTFSDYGINPPHHQGAEVDTVCPHCSHTRKKQWDRCLSVNTDKGTWICQHCGWSGSLGNGGKMPGYGEPLRKMYSLPTPIETPTPTTEISAWFKRRGISLKTLEDNRVTGGKSWSGAEGKDVTTILFPYYRDDVLINVKYRALHKKAFHMVKDAERVLYGLNDIDYNAGTVVIVEGEIDKLSLWEAGIKSCVSVPDGAPSPNSSNYESKFDFLATVPSLMNEDGPIRKVVLAVDNDEPGLRLQGELVRRFFPERCFLVKWPEGCKDANDVLVNHGAEKLRQCIDGAMPHPVTGILRIEGIIDQVWDYYHHGLEDGKKTGLWSLDEIYRVMPGMLTIITGSPGSGKSVFIDNVMMNMSRDHGWKFGVFSPENMPLPMHAARLMAIRQNKPFNAGPTNRMSPEEADEAMWWINDHIYFIYPEDNEEHTLDNILKKARALIAQEGIIGLVIDPWNEIERTGGSTGNEVGYISECLRKMRRFARDNRVHVFLVAHPTKLQKQADGKYPVPSPYDISGSAHFYNRADQCLSVYRDREEGNAPVQVHVQKMRFAHLGELGVAELLFRPATSTYQAIGYKTNSGRTFYSDQAVYEQFDLEGIS